MQYRSGSAAGPRGSRAGHRTLSATGWPAAAGGANADNAGNAARHTKRLSRTQAPARTPPWGAADHPAHPAGVRAVLRRRRPAPRRPIGHSVPQSRLPCHPANGGAPASEAETARHRVDAQPGATRGNPGRGGRRIARASEAQACELPAYKKTGTRTSVPIPVPNYPIRGGRISWTARPRPGRRRESDPRPCTRTSARACPRTSPSCRCCRSSRS